MTAKQRSNLDHVAAWIFRGGTTLGVFLAVHQFNEMNQRIEESSLRVERALLNIAVLTERVDGHTLTFSSLDRRLDKLENKTD